MALGGVDTKEAVVVSGAAISPEVVQQVVSVAQEIEPNIANIAQETLEKETARNEQAAKEAQNALAEQEARKPEAVRQQEASLQAAKEKLRTHEVVTEDGNVEKKIESAQEHVQRLREEEHERLVAQEQAKEKATILATDAVTAIEPKLDHIHKVAEEELAQRAQALTELAKKAGIHKQQNEAKQTAHAQEQAKNEAIMQAQTSQFTHGDGEDHHVRPSSSSKLVEQLRAATAALSNNEDQEAQKEQPTVIAKAAEYENKLAASTKLTVDDKQPEQSQVKALVRQFEAVKKTAKATQASEPRRSTRIAQLEREVGKPKYK